MSVVQAGRAEKAGTAEAHHRTLSERLPRHSGQNLGAARDNYLLLKLYVGPSLHLFCFETSELYLILLERRVCLQAFVFLQLCTIVV